MEEEIIKVLMILEKRVSILEKRLLNNNIKDFEELLKFQEEIDTIFSKFKEQQCT